MNIIDRVFLALYSLFIGLFSLILLFVPFYEEAYWWTSHVFDIYRFDWQYVLIPGFFFIISIRFLMTGLKSHASKNRSIVKHTSYGEISISLNTLEGMAQKSAREINGLREIRATVHPLAEGILIHINALTVPDANIPETTVKVQQSIKEYIEQYSGIEVREVKVSIENIASISKGRVE
ncbi:putative alkaline shock family protein YloU [Anaerosolibacter carboniphilus]|uniref:Putative alkaline shock family protein YloU n=1 Tax=Anaerosolibacter carboniphilus TaxID=1417629 RepID=A0A841KSR7_9FIRM|nr:alkaline shock response membrane anchor protein AmaP [Anaerosolibacter carboniphilus]MBB6216626.1 putative alkaline shock family protein YloU [Anaerosolibacter carboniphilus]